VTSKSPACPQCGKTDTVAKVNHIYLENLSAKPLTEDLLIPHVLRWPIEKPAKSKKTYDEVTFLKQFNPPSGQTVVIRQVNPDLAVVFFSLLALFLLFKIYISQRGAFFIALGFLALFYLVYFIGRKFIMRKFKQRQEADLLAKKQAETAIGRWMKMYYCWEEGIVFLPGEKQAVPLDQIRTYLYGASAK
jgi:hypothetical protein